MSLARPRRRRRSSREPSASTKRGVEMVRARTPTARPSASPNSRWVQPPLRPSSGSMTTFAGAPWRVSASRSSAQILDVDQRQLACGRQADPAAPRHLEQFERLAVAGTVDRRRTDDRPVEAATLRPAPPPWPSTRRRATASGSRAASEETWTKRRTPPAVAAASIASVPATLPCSKAAASGALITPATWTIASASATSCSRAPRSSRLPLTQTTRSRVRLLAAGQRLDFMPGGERCVDQVRADEAGAAGDRELHSGDQGFRIALPRAPALARRTSARRPMIESSSDRRPRRAARRRTAVSIRRPSPPRPRPCRASCRRAGRPW